MSNIQIPGNKGVPISPYPKEMYEQLFGCATINCDFTVSDYVWRCPKCGQLQTTEQDLPRSIPLGSMELKKPSVENGNGSIKRKRKPKKKG